MITKPCLESPRICEWKWFNKFIYNFKRVLALPKIRTQNSLSICYSFSFKCGKLIKAFTIPVSNVWCMCGYVCTCVCVCVCVCSVVLCRLALCILTISKWLNIHRRESDYFTKQCINNVSNNFSIFFSFKNLLYQFVLM